MNTYWNSKGKHQTVATRLEKLFPTTGAAPTQAGEIFRCACNAYYDFYNNGGWNKLTYATQHLSKVGVFRKATAEQKQAISIVRKISSAEVQAPFSEVNVNAFELFIDTVIEFILANPDLETADNTVDAFQVWCDKRDEASAAKRKLFSDRMAQWKTA